MVFLINSRTLDDAGRELLSFLSSHQATVCNTWFEKKDIHKQTWQHPKSKQWSCIDLVVREERNRGICVDVAVKRGAVCNTDHHLVCAMLRLRGIRYGRRRGSRAKDKRFDVEKMAISKDGESAERDEYLEKVLERTREAWCEDNEMVGNSICPCNHSRRCARESRTIAARLVS